jgi:hypothetical protein
MKLASAVAGILALQAGSWAGVRGDDLLFDELARRWLERNSVQASAKWETLLDQRYAHLALGVFDVYLPPASLRDARALKEASTALVALLDTQHGWASWVAGEDPVRREPDVLTKWLKGLAPRQLGSREAAGADLAELAQAGGEVRAALAEYAKTQRSGIPLGVEREVAGVRLALIPRRGEFVELVCVAGSLDSYLRPTAWNPGLTTWLEYQARDVRLLALEYSASEGGGSFEQGEAVGARNPAALGQLVTQAATRGLLERLYAGALDPALASGMANALVIDLYGELDTRIDGDVRSRSSQGTSVFVPGGNPDGGVLPPTSAENRWRGTKGKDHFLGVLSQVQKQSGKKAPTRPEKLARFELCSDDGSRKELVNAPFLGPKAVRPGDEVWPDYLELVRCYGVGFLHWLRVQGAPKASDSPALFGQLLRRIGRAQNAEELPKILLELYGQPLSADSLDGLFDGATLEGRFLASLAK